MTYIHSNNSKNVLNYILASLIFTVLVGAVSLVALYNNEVNLNHNIAAAKSELDSIGAKNTALNNQVVAALGNMPSGDLAAQYGLVQDNHPQYLSATAPNTANPSWPIASQQ